MTQLHFQFRDAFALDVFAALVVHWVYNKYEVQPIDYVPTTFLLVIVPALLSYFFLPFSKSVFSAAVYGFSFFHAALLASILVYRVSPFHPLAKYPGPFLAKFSKLWGIFMTATGKQHKHIIKLHEKYGPFVRVGPNELSCLDANAITPIMGTQGLPKGPIWDARTVPGTVRSLIALRDLSEHRRRRKPWTNAFNTSAIKDYEPVIVKRTLQLSEILEEGCKNNPGRSVDMAVWMSYFTFDFMGDMAFGGGFELMSEGDKDGIWDLMRSGLKMSTLLHHIPWIMAPLWKSPQAIASIYSFFNFAGRLVNQRLSKKEPTKDLFYHLFLSDDPSRRDPMSPHISYTQMITDTILAMVAGSDTTATVMSNILYYLISTPSVYKRLQEEIDRVFPRGEGDALDSTRLAECQLLNAVINEVMRLQPPLPMGSNRSTLQDGEGKQVGLHYVPPGTAIYIPLHALQRSSEYFSPYPNTFWPDRWLQEDQRHQPFSISQEDQQTVISPDTIPPVHIHLLAFIPFSAGPANCAGKNLALVEMRMVIALLIQRFEMRFEDGYDASEWEKSLEEWFLLVTGKLPIVFQRRL